MKKILYTFILAAASFAATAQTKIIDLKRNNDFFHRRHYHQNLSDPNQSLGLKINPYWEDVSAPHTYNSYIPQIKVPAYNSVWALLEYDTVYIGKSFLHTDNSGKTWLNDTVQAPANYGIGTIAATDANTCYASMNDDINGLGGGIFKTTDGGYQWKQLAKGKIFDSTSYPDFVYFFDARNGLAVGDNNGDTSRLEMYTTSDAGATWLRVSKQNLPPTVGSAHSFSFNVYAAFENRFWFFGYDNLGNTYTYVSDDLGHDWKLYPFNLVSLPNAFAFADKLNGLGVSFDNNGIVYEVATHDGGKTWQNKSYTGYPMGGFLTIIPGTHTFVSTLPGGFTPVYGSSYSNDYGATWKIIDSGANAVHSAVQFLSPFIGWTGAAGYPLATGGMYKWKLNISLDENSISATGNSKTIISDLKSSPSVRLYPNPASDILQVDGLNASAKTTLLLFTNSGRLIQQSAIARENYTYSLQSLAAGSYYIKIQSGEKTTTLKFVKQ